MSQPPTFSVLTYNFVSLPLISKKLNRRLDVLTEEVAKIQPDIICFQEIWWGYVRRKILKGLEPLGYQSCSMNTGPFFNGLLTLVKGELTAIEVKNLKPVYNGFNTLLIETMGFKGYQFTKVKLPNLSEINIFNVHLSANWGDKFEAESKYSKVQVRALNLLAKRINSLNKQKIIVAGDFDIPLDFFYYKRFLKISGLKNVVPDDFITILPSLFFFKMPHGGRRDHIFTKNLKGLEVKDVRLMWNEIGENIIQLSDHAGILVTFKF